MNDPGDRYRRGCNTNIRMPPGHRRTDTHIQAPIQIRFSIVLTSMHWESILIDCTFTARSKYLLGKGTIGCGLVWECFQVAHSGKLSIIPTQALHKIQRLWTPADQHAPRPSSHVSPFPTAVVPTYPSSPRSTICESQPLNTVPRPSSNLV